MILHPADMGHRDAYKLLTGLIVPRPIAWVSTIDVEGCPNLAPFSFFTVVCSNPMTMLFCPGPLSSGGQKDTLRNIQAVPEFVINLTDEKTAAAMNLSATELPSGQSEFEWAKVTPAPSETIRVPRVLEAPASFECTLQQIVTVSEQPGGGSAIFGEVQAITIRDDIYVDGYVVLDALRPIGRLSGPNYAHINDIFGMERQPAPASTD